MSRLVCGVGTNDVGRFQSHDGKVGTREYNMWNAMLQRCYSVRCQERNPSYKGCYVNPEFHSFQSFCEWGYMQRGFHDNFELDKDLLVPGNKEYGPNTCVFVPKAINCLTLKRKRDRGEYPIGVTLHPTNLTFTAQVAVGGQRMRKAGFAEADDAFQWYKETKEEMVGVLAEEYKDRIDSRVYNVLKNWEVKYDD